MMFGLPVLGTLAAAWAVVMAIVIILERRSAAATIAWLLVLAFLPIVGLIAYRLIGPLRLERRKLRRVAARTVATASPRTTSWPRVRGGLPARPRAPRRRPQR